jgi:hypothetical protein
MGPFTRRWTRSAEVATPWTSCLRLVMRRSGVRFPEAALAFNLMGLQQRLVEASCCPSPLPVSTLILPGP